VKTFSLCTFSLEGNFWLKPSFLRPVLKQESNITVRCKLLTIRTRALSLTHLWPFLSPLKDRRRSAWTRRRSAWTLSPLKDRRRSAWTRRCSAWTLSPLKDRRRSAWTRRRSAWTRRRSAWTLSPLKDRRRSAWTKQSMCCLSVSRFDGFYLFNHHLCTNALLSTTVYSKTTLNLNPNCPVVTTTNWKINRCELYFSTLVSVYAILKCTKQSTTISEQL